MPRAEQRKESLPPAGPGAEFTNLFYYTLKPQDQNIQSIRIKQITTQSKQNYIAYWETQAQAERKMQCYMALNRQYTVANHLTMVTDQNLDKVQAQ